MEPVRDNITAVDGDIAAVHANSGDVPAVAAVPADVVVNGVAHNGSLGGRDTTQLSIRGVPLHRPLPHEHLSGLAPGTVLICGHMVCVPCWVAWGGDHVEFRAEVENGSEYQEGDFDEGPDDNEQQLQEGEEEAEEGEDDDDDMLGQEHPDENGDEDEQQQAGPDDQDDGEGEDEGEDEDEDEGEISEVDEDQFPDPPPQPAYEWRPPMKCPVCQLVLEHPGCGCPILPEDMPPSLEEDEDAAGGREYSYADDQWARRYPQTLPERADGAVSPFCAPCAARIGGN
ncbi:uncharacterized protein THITE_129198 [Thermothielavioides terrestris NRRL 8126]|uniref:Uncharacterized protein n=1 Tax=Thermothielavioides terrestris (strain ATCC 38088 / NRRL 8126) TaxID=578455 RepID=G2R4J4_THETT|nr:uncharacterized protein THITE_129198 [Thermothielavioides terrestris NRRL 8126]AEO65229.1 hypothetical protein THITE_129198 [Thermothielavioides terrestris NRRL 8126]